MWISLIGFMASGKSAVARAVGEGARLPTVDLDTEVERLSGRPISAIFADEGVVGFRNWERRALARLSPERRLIIATGGGTVESLDCARRLRECGVVVWLDAPWEVLRRRLESDRADRPLLAHLGWDGLVALQRRRQRLYAATADFRLRSDLESPAALARAVLACSLFWRRHGWAGAA